MGCITITNPQIAALLASGNRSGAGGDVQGHLHAAATRGLVLTAHELYSPGTDNALPPVPMQLAASAGGPRFPHRVGRTSESNSGRIRVKSTSSVVPHPKTHVRRLSMPELEPTSPQSSLPPPTLRTPPTNITLRPTHPTVHHTLAPTRTPRRHHIIEHDDGMDVDLSSPAPTHPQPKLHNLLHAFPRPRLRGYPGAAPDTPHLVALPTTIARALHSGPARHLLRRDHDSCTPEETHRPFVTWH
ncbi:hypothetical protein B0H12DRAFT_1072316 [Mycena haematopus]|nr:hypothetical protein B0H12DRAFT_1072316 [Mycena haematopus]